MCSGTTWTPFQSTLPRRERPPTVRNGRAHAEFQSTLPRRERPAARCRSSCRVSNFNPRSREGSDAGTPRCWRSSSAFQSTLPRRERPCAGVTDGNFRTISIHAPAKGATRAFAPSSVSCDNFNPRSREGSDHHGSDRVWRNQDFNPRSREGSDSKNHQDYSQ